MNDPSFNPGFRFSPFDAVILLLGGAAAVSMSFLDPHIGPAVGFVVLHFFLFCNVVRMSRPFELTWAGAFVVGVALFAADVAAWPAVFGVCLGLTVVLVALETRRPSYHGVGWRTLNPELPEWWRARKATQPE